MRARGRARPGGDSRLAATVGCATRCDLLHQGCRADPQPLDSSENQHVTQATITVDGAPVEIPAYVGIDRVRAVQAAVHTHDTSGAVWLEGRDTGTITLGQFFTVWGVRFDERCLGATCGGVRVQVDGTSAPGDPRAVVLVRSGAIDVTVSSA